MSIRHISFLLTGICHFFYFQLPTRQVFQLLLFAQRVFLPMHLSPRHRLHHILPRVLLISQGKGRRDLPHHRHFHVDFRRSREYQ